ncbi:unnamed protein product [Clavelina lepadiformis]|uniref:Uncharacterized protein n=1 Tax=Clavelina lepadiformis TaxID=159417 RepID=A0ABP0EXE2_CLALP
MRRDQVLAGTRVQVVAENRASIGARLKCRNVWKGPDLIDLCLLRLDRVCDISHRTFSDRFDRDQSQNQFKILKIFTIEKEVEPGRVSNPAYHRLLQGRRFAPAGMVMHTESQMSAYGYSYEPTAAATGYLGNARGPSSFGNPVGGGYPMPGSTYSSPYGSSSQPGSIQGISGVSTSIASGMSPVPHSSHHSMQTPSSGYSTAPPPLGSASGGFHGFSSAYGPAGHSSYGGLMNQYQSCPGLSEAVLHQGPARKSLRSKALKLGRGWGQANIFTHRHSANSGLVPGPFKERRRRARRSDQARLTRTPTTERVSSWTIVTPGRKGGRCKIHYEGAHASWLLPAPQPGRSVHGSDVIIANNVCLATCRGRSLPSRAIAICPDSTIREDSSTRTTIRE